MDPSPPIRLGLSAGLILLVPAVAGLTIKGPETPKPSPGKAALTINVDSEDSFGDGAGARRHIALRAVGQPPDSSTRLVSSSGRNVATVEKAADARCSSGTSSYDTGLAGKETTWCLSVTSPHAGSEVIGVLKGSAADVSQPHTAQPARVSLAAFPDHTLRSFRRCRRAGVAIVTGCNQPALRLG